MSQSRTEVGVSSPSKKGALNSLKGGLGALVTGRETPSRPHIKAATESGKVGCSWSCQVCKGRKVEIVFTIVKNVQVR